MLDKKIGIIGCGNMGEAILKGLAGVLEKSTRIMVSELDAKRREYIQDKYKIILEIDNNLVVKYSDVIIIAVKPKDSEDVLKKEICCGVSPDKLIISVAAGVTTKRIEAIVGKNTPVVRAMPNMAAIIGKAVTSISAGSSASVRHMDAAHEIFSVLGDVVEVDEKLVDAVTAVSGSGPAYFFYLAEALMESAKLLGLKDETSRRLVVKTALGSASLLEELGEKPEILRGKITSRGGTTEAAIKIFDSKKIKSIIKSAVKAAFQRSKQLSRR